MTTNHVVAGDEWHWRLQLGVKSWGVKPWHCRQVVVSNIFYFHPESLKKWSNLKSIFFSDGLKWNHQLVVVDWPFFLQFLFVDFLSAPVVLSWSNAGCAKVKVIQCWTLCWVPRCQILVIPGPKKVPQNPSFTRGMRNFLGRRIWCVWVIKGFWIQGFWEFLDGVSGLGWIWNEFPWVLGSWGRVVCSRVLRIRPWRIDPGCVFHGRTSGNATEHGEPSKTPCLFYCFHHHHHHHMVIMIMTTIIVGDVSIYGIWSFLPCHSSRILAPLRGAWNSCVFWQRSSWRFPSFSWNKMFGHIWWLYRKLRRYL